MVGAERVVQAVELVVHRLLVREVQGIRGVEVDETAALPLHVGCHARPLHDHAVRLAVSGAPNAAAVARWVSVAALERVAGAEVVTEDTGALVRHEGVLAAPARAVLRPEGVEVDEAAVLVLPGPELVRLEAVDGASEVGQPAEDVVVPAVPRPARPVGQVERPGALLGKPGEEAEVRQCALPALHGPVRAVRGLAGGDDVGEGRPVVRAAGVLELELFAEGPPAAGSVEPELDLLPHSGRMERVERAPGEDVPAAGAGGGREDPPA